jgi:uncharacterized cupin superfamily protein
VSAKASIAAPVFDELREHPGFECRRARLGRQVDSEKLGLSLWELPPGQAAYPYHFHLAEEEIVVVLEGRPEGGGLSRHFRYDDAIGYFDAEETP